MLRGILLQKVLKERILREHLHFFSWNYSAVITSVPKHYRKNFINRDLYRVKKLTSNFEQKFRILRDKYTKAGYPSRFSYSIINSFNPEKKDRLTARIFVRRKNTI